MERKRKREQQTMASLSRLATLSNIKSDMVELPRLFDDDDDGTTCSSNYYANMVCLHTHTTYVRRSLPFPSFLPSFRNHGCLRSLYYYDCCGDRAGRRVASMMS